MTPSNAGFAFVLAMASPGDSPASWMQFLPFALILAIFYFIILLPMRKNQKKIQDFQGGLKVGDRVITTGGIYGVITKVNDLTIQLQVADKVRFEIAKTAIGGMQGQEPVVTTDGGNT